MPGRKKDRQTWTDRVEGLESPQQRHTGLLVLLARGLCRWSRGLRQRLAGLTFLVLLPLLLGDSIFMVWAQAHMQEKKPRSCRSAEATQQQWPHGTAEAGTHRAPCLRVAGQLLHLPIGLLPFMDTCCPGWPLTLNVAKDGFELLILLPPPPK